MALSSSLELLPLPECSDPGTTTSLFLFFFISQGLSVWARLALNS